MLITTTPLVISGPANEPVTLTEVKDALRIDDPADATELARQDALLELYREMARSYVEGRTGWTIHEQTLEITLAHWPASTTIMLPRATPLIEIVSAKYKDSAGAETTWSAAEYIEDVDSMPGQLVLGYNESWPSFTPYPVSPIRIQYRAGIEVTSPLTEAPASFKVPILLLIGGLWENRESETTADRLQQVAMKYGVEAFLSAQQWKLKGNVF